jgi:hypothetical protein
MSALYPPDDRPKGVDLPEAKFVALPMDVPSNIRAFFGKTGRWWGTWKSPQVGGKYDAVLAIREIYRREDHWEAKVIYASADYPKWYVEGGTWEKTGSFDRKPGGKMVLSVRHPAVGVMEFWLEATRLQGRLSMRFMLSLITLRPAP